MKKAKEVMVLVLSALAAAGAAGLGVNINLAERGGTFTDAVKENYRWTAVDGGGSLTAGQTDGQGWPAVDAQYVLDFRPVAEWAGQIDDPEAYRIDVSGTWLCRFTGQATVSGASGGSVQNASYDATENTTTFEFVVTGPPGPGHGLLIISFTDTKRTTDSPAGSGITGFRMMRPGYPLDGAPTFTDEFAAALTGIDFASIRFMNFSNTNGCDPDYPGVTEWSGRKRIEDASQGRIEPLGKMDGGAWEYVVEISNMAGMDPWINIPISATAEYAESLAVLFRDNLDPGLNLYVESSNEVWNTAPGFEQSLYNQAQANALGIGEHENHARHAVELAQIFGDAFGPGSLNSRVRVVLCSHKPMLKWWVVPMLEYIESNFGPPKDYINAIACQTYYGGGADEGEDAQKILDDCHDDITIQIDETGEVNEAGRVQWIAEAAGWELAGGFFSYEGGPDHGGGSTTNISNRIMAERDERMGEEWTYNLDDAFFQLGGGLAMQFTLSSAYTRYGCWGLTDDIAYPERNYKYAAARALAQSLTGIVRAPGRTAGSEWPLNISVIRMGSAVKIEYETGGGESPEISVFSTSGKMIKRINAENESNGRGTVTWDASAEADGVYIVTIRDGKRQASMMVLGIKR